MAVHSTHPSYDEHLPAWLRARDVFAGEDAIKAAGVRYLPKLDSQSEDEYLAYKNRTSFFNASARTADGFVGLVFRREPTFKIPEKSTGVGRALNSFIEKTDLFILILTLFVWADVWVLAHCFAYCSSCFKRLLKKGVSAK